MSKKPYNPDLYEVVTDEDYPPIKHTAESFHMDAGDIILADDVSTNDTLRFAIGRALGNLERLEDTPTGPTLNSELIESQILLGSITNIGRLVLCNVVKNGYTKAKLGVDDE